MIEDYPKPAFGDNETPQQHQPAEPIHDPV